jgi:pyruvate,orthophosphate dikinase
MATTTGGKLVYRLEEGSASMSQLLGGKGAGVSEMARIGIPVPPGFVITTEACLKYYELGRNFPDGLWDTIVQNMHHLEAESGKEFGGKENPLIVSVRSGAPISMPGMMDTVLNLGTNDVTVQGMARLMEDERPALDAYRRFIQGFANIVLGVDKNKFESLLDKAKEKRGLKFDYELNPDALRELIGDFQGVVKSVAGHPVPQDPWEQLRDAVQAVFSSWNNPRATTYRHYYGISHDMGTACVVMGMVFGNLGPDSGTGVMFTRDPATGENALYGDFLVNAQGEDVVAGIRNTQSIISLQQDAPELYRQLEEKARDLETHYRDVQDIEFTVENGKLFILQTRTAKRTAPSAVKIAVDLAREGVISQQESIGRVVPDEIAQVLLPRFDVEAKAKALEDGKRLAQGLGASPGAATGAAAMDPDTAVVMAEQGQKVILVRPETSPDDVHGIIKAQGVLTSRGGMTSHAAVVTRGLGKPCVVGCEELHVDLEARTATANGTTIKEGEVISVDGATGEVFVGGVATFSPNPAELTELNTLLGWADEARTLRVWANADTPEQAREAREYGAEGIGLCRTEHMFFAEERLPHIQRLLTVGTEASRLLRETEKVTVTLETAPAAERDRLNARLSEAKATVASSEVVKAFNEELTKLEAFQTEDFYGILQAMEGLPVVIRLLDAPLHEFLPKYVDLVKEVAVLEATGVRSDDLEEKKRTRDVVEELMEINPMMGHRGCRVGVTMPEIYEMQVRAIVSAAAQLTKEGHTVRPEIMIPVVSHVNELHFLHDRLERVAETTRALFNVTLSHKFGTMIEVPRAALTAGEIASVAQFFSFGSNDLTQMTFAYSRDDAEVKFLREYVESEVLPVDPFTSLDTKGVGRLMRIAVDEGRAVNPTLEIGICGEHGGDPRSVAFCHALGLNYVSASPFRVPVARLAAAQSALGQLKPAE